MRERKSGTIFLTGGTGFLGSHLAVHLLSRGYRVVMLARKSNHMGAQERVIRLLNWFAISPDRGWKLEVMEGDIEEPDLGLGRETYDHLARSIDEIIHAASNTSFAERKRQQVESCNVTGLRNVLELARQSKCRFFHYISTAYVAGERQGVCKEELVEQNRFTNVYEETKYRGERMVADVCTGEGIRHTMYRPSIVYGDSRTGKSIRFNAVYYPVRTLLFLKSLYEIDIRERGGKKAAEIGVRLQKDGSLRLPIRVTITDNGGVNLIPVDHFVEAFTAIMETSLGGGVFHIVNSKLKRCEELIDYTQRLFGMKGIRPVTACDGDNCERNPLEALFDGYVEAYAPYIRDTRIFENRKTARVLVSRSIACPDLDFEIFSRCMHYAIEVGWGTKLFKRD
jgi:nucleoside-diphosphate-sugar epimerase